MTQPDPTAGYRRTLTEAARERLLAEMSGGMKPCLWCIGVPVFDSRDDLLAHIHDQHPPTDLRLPPSPDCREGDPVTQPERTAAIADMRIEAVKRELNQGALAGFRSEITDSAALMVIAALDSFDQDALRRAHQEGRAAAAADIRAFARARERGAKEYPPASAEAFRRNDAVLGAYRRAAEIAEVKP